MFAKFAATLRPLDMGRIVQTEADILLYQPRFIVLVAQWGLQKRSGRELRPVARLCN